jgi:hypothetical protein
LLQKVSRACLRTVGRVTDNSAASRAPATSRAAGSADIAGSLATIPAFQSSRWDGGRAGQIDLADLLAAWTDKRQPWMSSCYGGTDPKVEPQLAPPCAPAVPDGDDPPSIPFGDLRNNVAGSLFEHVQAAFVGTHNADHAPPWTSVKVAPRGVETNPHRTAQIHQRRDEMQQSCRNLSRIPVAQILSSERLAPCGIGYDRRA